MSYLKFRWSLPIALLVTQGLHAQSMPYATVTDERLQHPEAGDWLMYRRTYDGSGFSPLKQITAANIGKLSLAWAVNTDFVEAHETTPIVNHGRMFVTTPQNNVIAYNAKTGVELWRYAKKYPEGLFQLHPTNRGVALYGDRVYMATTDCALVALDAATGKEVWDVPIDDWKTGCYSTLAPLAARGKILVGYSGGEFGVRGSLSAIDAETGKRIWRTYTVPTPNERGGATWRGDGYKRGGGSIWITGTFDPASNITYWGTGNPSPWICTPGAAAAVEDRDCPTAGWLAIWLPGWSKSRHPRPVFACHRFPTLVSRPVPWPSTS
jgi:alcohol dehydrogenase (cytochrome c)